MNHIDKIKHDGAVNALSEKIDSIIYDIRYNNWGNLKNDGKYCRLSEAIEDAENKLSQIKELFAALQQMKPGNK